MLFNSIDFLLFLPVCFIIYWLMAYVAFFLQLVTGSIERAIFLLPQFYKKRVFKEVQAIFEIKDLLLMKINPITVVKQWFGIVDNHEQPDKAYEPNWFGINRMVN